jgi:hypothetical protein
MCTIAGAIGAIGAVAQFAGQKQATDDYNAQAAAAHRDAEIAATNKYKDLDTKYVYNAKSLNQEGYNAALKAREEIATGVASAGSSGVDASSITLQNLVNSTKTQAATNESNIQSKRDDNKDTLIANDASVQAEAQQRINSIPFKRGPNPLSLMLGIATSAANAGQQSGMISGFNFQPASTEG